MLGLDFSGTFAKMDRKTAFFRGGPKKSSTGGMGCRGELRESLLAIRQRGLPVAGRWFDCIPREPDGEQ